MSGRGYKYLKCGIIYQAVKDYRYVLKRLKKKPTDIDLNIQYEELQRFFKSEWFRTLCDIDAEKIMNQIEEDVNKK